MSVFCVGLTGGLASGKTTAGKLFAERGVAVVDADEVAAELTGKDGAALPALRRVLGDWAFAADGTLARAEVRRRVFSDAATRKLLEAALHPQIRACLRQRLQEATTPYAVGIVPLLFESGGWGVLFQRIAVVHCAPKLQRLRAARRDGAGDASAIMAAQLPGEERLRRADDIIDNGGDLPALAAAVAAMHGQYLQFAAQSATMHSPPTSPPKEL